MFCYDLFNGDADGIIALNILRHFEPRESQLVTGLKREIDLVDKLDEVHNAELNLIDISLEKNTEGVQRALDNGCTVRVFDHHRPGTLKHERLALHVDMSPKVCSALIVHDYTQGLMTDWAATACYGDNLAETAEALLNGATAEKKLQLKECGEALNYNAYGETVEDQCVSPKELYEDIRQYPTPMEFLNSSTLYANIRQTLLSDEDAMEQCRILHQSEGSCVLLLPDGAPSRRMSGLYSNRLANEHPNRAHVVLTHCTDVSGYRASIRAPLANPHNADKLAIQFPQGGGRSRAAGINLLQESDLDHLLKLTTEVFS